MSYIIANLSTGQTVVPKNYHSYDDDLTARRVLSRKFKNNPDWCVMECEAWRLFKAIKFPVKMVQRVNLMSGRTYWEAEDTPGFCSPSSEAYWSM